jgi:hypothetical protein
MTIAPPVSKVVVSIENPAVTRRGDLEVRQGKSELSER